MVLCAQMTASERTCRRCDATVPVESDICIECGCPSSISREQLEHLAKGQNSLNPKARELWTSATGKWNGLRERFHPAIYPCTRCNCLVSYGDFFCSACGYEFTSEDTAAMFREHDEKKFSDHFHVTTPLALFGIALAAMDYLEEEWNPVVAKTPTRIHPHVYNCVACLNKVAWGDAYCRFCGIKFSENMCRHMNENMQWNAQENYPSLIFIASSLLVVIWIAIS